MEQDYGSAEELLAEAAKIEGGDTGEPEAPQEGQSQLQEEEFEIEGKKIPYSKLDPKTVREWYSSHSNASNWRKENTDRAQKLAAERKEWEAKHPEYEKVLGEYDRWNKILESDPTLTQLIELYRRNPSARDAVSNYLREKNVAPAYKDPELTKELEEMKQWRKQVEEERKQSAEERQQAKIERERQEALAALKELDPNVDMDKLQKFVGEGELNTLTDLYKLYYHAFLNGSKKDIEKQTEKKVLDNIKKKQTAAVEKGSAESGAKLPDNVDISGKTLDQVFDDVEDKMGWHGR